MRRSNEYNAFNNGMKTILRADPKAVKTEMWREAIAQTEDRRSRGEKKRGRQKAAGAPDSEVLAAMSRASKARFESLLSLSFSLQQRLPTHLQWHPLHVRQEK